VKDYSDICKELVIIVKQREKVNKKIQRYPKKWNRKTERERERDKSP
jgi:hypothetical protein